MTYNNNKNRDHFLFLLSDLTTQHYLEKAADGTLGYHIMFKGHTRKEFYTRLSALKELGLIKRVINHDHNHYHNNGDKSGEIKLAYATTSSGNLALEILKLVQKVKDNSLRLKAYDLLNSSDLGDSIPDIIGDKQLTDLLVAVNK